MTKRIRHSIVTSEGIQPKATRGAHSSKKTSLNHYNHRSELKGCFFSFIHLPVTQTNKCVFYWQPNKKSTPSWISSLKILSVSKLSEWVSAGGNENQTHTHTCWRVLKLVLFGGWLTAASGPIVQSCTLTLKLLGSKRALFKIKTRCVSMHLCVQDCASVHKSN